MRRKRRQRTGANSTANSLRNLGGIPSGPDALFVLRDDNTLRTLRVEMIGGLIGLERGKVGGSGALESSREEFAGGEGNSKFSTEKRFFQILK